MTNAIVQAVENLRNDMNSRMGTLEREVNDLHRRFDDTPAGMQIARLASDQAITAVIGVAELRDILRAEVAKGTNKNRIAVALVGAIALIAVGVTTLMANANARDARDQAGIVADQHYEKQRKDFALYEREICAACMNDPIIGSKR